MIMAEKRKKSFGEVYFSELNQNEYLRKIYDDILYNYALKVFGFTNRKKKEIPIEHALQFADLLSKSNHSTLADEQKMWAQEIITMLLYVYDEDPRVSYMAGSVLEAVGNYQGIDIAKSTYNGTDILDRLASEYKKDYYAIPGEDGKYFMAAQKTAFDSFSTEYFSYSGPTSMGKSYIMRMFIKQQIMSGVKKNYALVVPTKALINEVRIKVTEDLNDNLHEFQYHIITAAGDAALESEEKNRNYIFIMTPERLLYLLINEKNIHLDYLFIDEAHKLSGADKRSTFYYQFVHMLSDREDKPRIFFASPNVPNPEIYLKLISDVDTETLLENRMSSRFSPVSQEKFLINLVGKEVSVYNEHTKEAIPLTSIAIEDADLIDVLLRFEKDRNGKEVQCIVYFPSTRKTVTAARDFAANRVERTECKELMDLANDIKNEVHGDYYLVDLIKKGVAYHIGYLPSSIRQRIEKLFKDGLITALFCTSTLIEGVNLPADNLFVTDFKNGKKHMKAVDFRNLIGRVGRLEYNLYGNVFLVAANEKAEEKYEELLKEDIKPQALSVEKGLTKPQKRNVIEALLAGTVEFEEYPKGKQSEDSYDLMRKFGIALLNDILMDRNTLVRREFAKVMKPGEEEKIRDNFRNRTEYLQENDITVSVDQSESLYQAISDQTNPLEFPKVLDDGSFDYDELTAFLNRLCRIFKWDLYESETLGHIGKYSHKHGRLMWYQVILAQWVRGRGLSTIMYQAIKNKEDNPKNAMYIDREYVDYDFSKNHENIVISDVLSVIDEVILFKLSNYFLKVSKAYTEIKGKEPEYDWYEYVEYGSTNKHTINIQKHGFSRESAIYILEHPEAGIVKQEKPLRLSWNAIQECKNEGVKNDAELIKYNIPELFE